MKNIKIISMVLLAIIALVPLNSAVSTTHDTAEYAVEYATAQKCPHCSTVENPLTEEQYEEVIQTYGEDTYWACMVICMTGLGIAYGLVLQAVMYMNQGMPIMQALALAGISMMYLSGVMQCHNLCSGGGGGGSYTYYFCTAHWWRTV